MTKHQAVFLKHYNKHTHMQGIHYHQRPKRELSNSTKLLLDQFSDEQLEKLLEELKSDEVEGIDAFTPEQVIVVNSFYAKSM